MTNEKDLGADAAVVVKACSLVPTESAPHAAPKNQVICAAIKFADGRIVRGHRHDGCFLYAQGWTPKPESKDHIQGFIDARNKFVTREEAMSIQIAAGIPSHMGTTMREGAILFSEDLY